ncbi:hypothetical protein [uncultured Psychrobacter sp.]|uniref:hypothetical protein n=1 Tax=uncultured Psychrobacter sp. TaxID=259303 RepID=UPI0030DBD379
MSDHTPREITHPYDESFERFLVSKPQEYELNILERHEKDKGLVTTIARDSVIKIKDNYSQDEMLAYGSITHNPEEKTGFDPVVYQAVLIENGVIKPSKQDVLSQAGFARSRFESDLNRHSGYHEFFSPNQHLEDFHNEARYMLGDENLADALLFTENKYAREELQDFDRKPLDQRGELRARHKLAQSTSDMFEENKDKKWRFASALVDKQRALGHATIGSDDYRSRQSYKEAIAEANNAMMQSSLLKENVIVLNGKVLSPERTKAHLNLVYSITGEEHVMDMHDTNSAYLIEKTDPAAVAATHIDPDSNEQLVSSIRFQEKADVKEDNMTTLFIVKDSDDVLWLRAAQENIRGEVHARNAAVFERLGIPAETFKQGVPASLDGLEGKDRRQRESDINDMLAQISPNNVRKMVSRQQNKEIHDKKMESLHPEWYEEPHYDYDEFEQEFSDPEPLPEPVKADTIQEVVSKAAYPVINWLDDEQLKTFKAISDDKRRPDAATDNIRQAAMVRDDRGETSFIVIADRSFPGPSAKELEMHGYAESFNTIKPSAWDKRLMYVETYDKDGYRKETDNEELMSLKLDHSAFQNPESIRAAIAGLDRFSDVEVLKDSPALKGFGVPGETHPLLKEAVELEAQPYGAVVQPQENPTIDTALEAQVRRPRF